MNSIEDYILQHIDEEPDLLKKMNRDVHVNLLRPRMLSGHLQGRTLKMFCQMIKPKSVLEIGTYAGYSALCIAEALADDAVLHTIEINDELEDFIRNYFEQSCFSEKIKLYIGDAFDILPDMQDEFDMVFIDGDKRYYWEYFELVFSKLKKGGFVLADNTLWDSKVVEEIKNTDEQTKGILKFNEQIALDKRVEKVILPLRDGISIIRKK